MVTWYHGIMAGILRPYGAIPMDSIQYLMKSLILINTSRDYPIEA